MAKSRRSYGAVRDLETGALVEIHNKSVAQHLMWLQSEVARLRNELATARAALDQWEQKQRAEGQEGPPPCVP